jgi:putative tricarboxylic transport membrane protein
VLGFGVGVLPAAGATVAAFTSYGLEKRISREPERFGKGAIEGVAGPEAANNSATAGAMVPLLTLGIPGSGSTAVMLGAFMIWGCARARCCSKRVPTSCGD